MNPDTYEKLKKIALKFPAYRVPEVSRYNLAFAMSRVLPTLKPGTVLDVGSRNSPFRSQVPHTKYVTLDIDPAGHPDLLCSVEDIKWKSDDFDVVLATEILEHLPYPDRAIAEMFRVLKPGGILILTTRFIFPYHGGPRDYYRFTPDSLTLLCKDFKTVEVVPLGNRLQSIWDLLAQGAPGILLRFLNPLIGRIDFQDRKCVGGYLVRAEK